jgi:hypothetical protein
MKTEICRRDFLKAAPLAAYFDKEKLPLKFW